MQPSNISDNTSRKPGRPRLIVNGRKRCSCDTCKSRGRPLALDAFSYNRTRKAYSSWCKSCQNRYNRKYRREHAAGGNSKKRREGTT